MRGVLKCGYGGYKPRRFTLYYYPTRSAAVGRKVVTAHSEYSHKGYWMRQVEGMTLEEAVRFLESQSAEGWREHGRVEVLEAIKRFAAEVSKPQERKEKKKRKVIVMDRWDVQKFVWKTLDRNCKHHEFWERRGDWLEVWICRRSLVVLNNNTDTVVFAPFSALKRGDVPEDALKVLKKLGKYLDELPQNVADVLRVAVLAASL